MLFSPLEMKSSFEGIVNMSDLTNRNNLSKYKCDTNRKNLEERVVVGTGNKYSLRFVILHVTFWGLEAI